jgi:hypothetical protein
MAGGIMTKRLLLIPVVFLVINAAYAQNSANPVPQLDAAVKELALNMHKKLVEGNAQKVILGQFSYRGGTSSPFANYWINQLTGELANMQGRTYTVLSAGTTGADRMISGEIIVVTNVIRVYTRLVRQEDRALESVFYVDFEQSAALNAMLVSGGGGGGSSSSAFPDEYEPDSWDNPVSYDIGIDENAPLMNRNFHEGSDEDFFLLIPERSGRLTMETTGNLDTLMYFYNYDTGDELDEDDDSGQGSNARIRYSVQAGTQYLAKVRPYNRSGNGNYGFRAYMTAPREGANSWENPLTYTPGIDENATVMNRSFQDYDDEDYILIVPASSGRLVMETTGRMDTYMYFYNYDTKEQLGENDDGGVDYNARIRYEVRAGVRYLVKIRDLDEGTGSYGFRAYMAAPREGTSSWENPLSYEPGIDENAAVRNRSLEESGDEDFFLIVPSSNGRLTMETTGRMDTYMYLYDYDTKEKLDENDDGGQNYNARIRYNVQAGKRYLVRIKDLDEGTGDYGFRAYLSR